MYSIKSHEVFFYLIHLYWCNRNKTGSMLVYNIDFYKDFLYFIQSPKEIKESYSNITIFQGNSGTLPPPSLPNKLTDTL